MEQQLSPVPESPGREGARGPAARSRFRELPVGNAFVGTPQLGSNVSADSLGSGTRSGGSGTRSGGSSGSFGISGLSGLFSSIASSSRSGASSAGRSGGSSGRLRSVGSGGSSGLGSSSSRSGDFLGSSSSRSGDFSGGDLSSLSSIVSAGAASGTTSSSGGTGSGDGSGGGSEESGDEEAAVPMRETVYGVLRPHLIGPLGSCRGGHRLWALSITFYAFSVGQFIAERLTEMVEAEPLCPEIWQSMVWEAQVVPLCIGLLATEVTVIMAEAVRPATTGRPATRSSRWLQLLLATPVSPQVLQRIRTHVRVSRTWAAGLGVVMLVSMARQYEQLEANLGRTELQRAVFTIVDTISLVPMLITITGWLLFLTIPSLIVCDDIERNTGRIIRLARKRRIRQPEWDGVMRSVHRANEGTKRLSSLLGPAIKMILLVAGALACHWLAVLLARKLHHLCHSSKPLVLLTGVEIIRSTSTHRRRGVSTQAAAPPADAGGGLELPLQHRNLAVLGALQDHRELRTAHGSHQSPCCVGAAYGWHRGSEAGVARAKPACRPGLARPPVRRPRANRGHAPLRR